MRGLYYRLNPFTPDSAGAASFFADTDALIVPIDMNGTVSTFRNRVGVEEESGVRVCSILQNRELSYIMGEPSEFSCECAGLMELFDHEHTVLLQGPVSSMVGLDLAAMSYELEELDGKPVMYVNCSGNGSYETGMAAAMKAVFKRIDDEPAEPQEGAFNILGINSVDHNDVRVRKLLVGAIEEAQGGEALSVWGAFHSWDHWKRARFASRNIVASVSALSLAKAMKRTWGIPWVSMDGPGVLSLPPVEVECAGARILVVSEQIQANLVRRLLEPCRCDVVVATFHTLAPGLAREGDKALSGEFDFCRLIEDEKHDLIIGDEALRSCMPNEQRFYPLPHSAVAMIALDDPEIPAFSDEWLEGLEIAIRNL